MENFNWKADLDEIFENAESVEEAAKQAKLIGEARKAMAEAEAADIRNETEKLENQRRHNEIVNGSAISFKKDIWPVLPNLLTALIGGVTCAATIKAASVKANSDVRIAESNNNARLQALGFWKKKQEEDLIDDKAIKTTNELFR